ncbi:MAG: type II toxin-antitoxin system RelE/ParE family toxin [Desulfobacteraceae bacterium]|nr:type II toxin-antitoxin system RelE/ParE family toxin [Desulfobacteraceae bacterium]
MYTIRFSKQALKARASMLPTIADRIDRELTAPAAYRGDWKPLQGSPFWWLRVGGWRAICEIVDHHLIIFVLKIGPRGDVYK